MQHRSLSLYREQKNAHATNVLNFTTKFLAALILKHMNANEQTQQAKKSFNEAPAWEGHEALPVNLVLEGGGMRSMFTAGILDLLLERGVFCELVIGVSAGALMGFNYVTGNVGYSCAMNLKWGRDPRYFSVRSYLRTGNVCGRDFMFEQIPRVLDPVDPAWFNDSPMKLVSVASNLELGEADYHLHHDLISGRPYLIASSSLPVVSKIVQIDGKKLLDGGTCDSIPIRFSMATGATKHIVVCTEPRDFVREPTKGMAILRRHYSDYPYYLERFEHRHFEYNRTYRLLQRMHDAGDAFVIWPPSPINIAVTDTNPDKLFKLYEEGYEVACRAWPALEKYLES